MALEGTTLKGWKLGKKLGAGACSDVYAVDSVAPLTDKNCDAFVMKLSPLVTVDAAKAKNKKRKKSAAERNADALYAEHLLYQSHLRDHPGLPYIPPGAYGEDQGYRFLVMERLGRTLETVLRDNGPIPSTTAAQLGLSLLDTLQYIHSKNIVYVDVKPDNFMLDRAKEQRVYFVDFGIADRYVMATGKHKEHKTGTIVGTPTFLSLNCHAGATASRRDDMEALLNVLIYLVRGDLPWQHASSDAEGAKIKLETSISELCKGLPAGWATMLTKARSHDFEEKPEYDFYTQQFEKLGAKAGSKEAFVWGSKKPKAHASAGTSPARKKSKSEDGKPSPATGKDAAPATMKAKAKVVKEAAPVATKTKEKEFAPIIAKTKTKDAAPTTTKVKTNDLKSSAAKNETANGKGSDAKQPARSNGVQASPNKLTKAIDAKKKHGRKEESDEEEEEAYDSDKSDESDGNDDVEFVKTGGKDPRRRRKAAARAVAAAAAAEAAAKQAEGTGRYELRSRTKN